jgi:hypothetical protein
MWLPNLAWQAQHGWPVFDLSADIADEYGGLGGRLGMLGEAFSIFSPFIGVLWLIGLVQLLRRDDWRAVRLPAFVFLIVTAVFLVTGGKGYYFAGMIVPLAAAGATWLAQRWSTRGLVLAGAGLAASAMVVWPALVPVLPAQTFADSVYPSFNDDQTETIGWPEYAAQVREVVAGLPDGTVVFTGNYGEAGAVEWYGVGAPAYSGHNGWRNWGPPPDGAGPVVVVYFRDPSDLFTGCQRAATLHNDVGIDNEEAGQDVWLCAGPIGSWSQRWPGLSHYDA